MSSAPKRQVITIAAGPGVIKVTNLATEEISPVVFAATNTLIEERIGSVKSIFIAEIKIVDFVIKDHVMFVPLAIIDIPATSDYFRLQTTEGPDLNLLYASVIEKTLGTLLMAEGQTSNILVIDGTTETEPEDEEIEPVDELIIQPHSDLLMPTDEDFREIMRKSWLNKPH